MPLEELVERIHRETAQKIAALREAAESEASDIAAATRAREDAMFKREVERHRTQLEFETRRTLSARRSEQQREFLEERERLLGSIREELEAHLASLPTAEEAEILKHLLRAAARIIPQGRIRLSTRAQEVLQGQLGTWTVDIDDTLVGGFILVSPAGDRLVDCTYAALADAFWMRRRIDIARGLLGEAMLPQEDIA